MPSRRQASRRGDADEDEMPTGVRPPPRSFSAPSSPAKSGAAPEPAVEVDDWDGPATQELVLTPRQAAMARSREPIAAARPAAAAPRREPIAAPGPAAAAPRREPIAAPGPAAAAPRREPIAAPGPAAAAPRPEPIAAPQPARVSQPDPAPRPASVQPSSAAPQGPPIAAPMSVSREPVPAPRSAHASAPPREPEVAPVAAVAPPVASDGDDIAVDEVDVAAGADAASDDVAIDEAAGDGAASDDVAIDDDDEAAARPPLLGELRRRFGLLPGRVRLAIVGTLAALVLAIVVLLATCDPAAACAEANDPVAELWDRRRDAIHGAMTATGASSAEGSWERVAARLDAHAGALRAGSLAACAAHRRGERSDELQVRHARCLSGQLLALKVLTDALAGADARTASGALLAVGELPPPAACDDLEALPAAIVAAEDPAVAAEAGLRREQLLAARLAVTMRRASEGLAIATPLLARARELGDRPVEVEVAGIIGSLHAIAGDSAAAELALTDAVWLADLVGDDELLARHMAALLRVIGLDRPADALRWRRHAETVIARLPAGSRGAAELVAAIGSLLGATEPGPAQALLQKALALAEAQDGAEHERVAAVLGELGELQLRQGELPAARASLTRALAINEARLGPDHLRVAGVLRSLAAVDGRSGEGEAAEGRLARALAIQEASLGREHPGLAPTLSALGGVLVARGDQLGARAHFERALAVEEKARGASHPSLAVTLDALGGVARDLGELEVARAHFERAEGIRAEASGLAAPGLAEQPQPPQATKAKKPKKKPKKKPAKKPAKKPTKKPTKK